MELHKEDRECDSFRWTTKGPSHVSILSQTPLPSRLLHNIEQSSLCYIVGPCWLSTLRICDFISFHFLAVLQGMWDLNSLARYWTHAPPLEAWSLNHWTEREAPVTSSRVVKVGLTETGGRGTEKMWGSEPWGCLGDIWYKDSRAEPYPVCI